MQVLNIHWMWTYEYLSQIDTVSGWFGSYNSIIELQINFCIWKMKKLVISIPKVVVKLIWGNAYLEIFFQEVISYKNVSCH